MGHVCTYALTLGNAARSAVQSAQLQLVTSSTGSTRVPPGALVSGTVAEVRSVAV